MHKSSKAILLVGFWLQAWKIVVREDKLIGTEVQIAVKMRQVNSLWDVTRKCSLQLIICTYSCL